MRRTLTAVALTIAVSTAAYADCRDEVASALERQRKSSAFRMETSMITEEGKVDMTVDYVLPDRMRQIVKSTKNPEPVETVLVGTRAWSRQKGGPWAPLNLQLTGALVSQMDETITNPTGKLGYFDCLGKKPVDGRDTLAYQGEDPVGGSNEKLDPSIPRLPTRPVRVIYVDATTGLPVRSVYARANKLDKPIFEADYSYPVDIKIEAPESAGQ